MKLQDSKEFIGKKFAMLTIVADAGRSKKFRMVCAFCDCGKTGTYALVRLKSGNTKSCGCQKTKAMVNAVKAITTHGLTNHQLYHVWSGIKDRCSDINNKNYGGRGISICDEWRNSFMAFYNWATENGWNENLEIDRKEVNGNYSPINCRFVTPKVNSRNKRNNHFLTFNNETKCVKEWSEIFSIGDQVILYRLKKLQWSTEKALTTPLIKKYATRVQKVSV